MENENLNDIQERLAEKVKKYIILIKKEYGDNMPKKYLTKISNIKNYNDILEIYDYGNINAWANDENISMHIMCR